MGRGNVGTLKKITMVGVTYAIVNDTDITVNVAAYDNEALPNGGGGGTTLKQTRRAEMLDGIQVRVADSIVSNRLKGIADAGESVNVVLELAGGIKYIGSAWFVGDSTYTTMDGIFTFSLAPVNGWTIL